MPPGWSPVAFWNVSQARTTRGSIRLTCACAFLSTVLTAVEMVSHQGMDNNQDVPSECRHASICDSKRSGGGSVSEEK